MRLSGTALALPVLPHKHHKTKQIVLLSCLAPSNSFSLHHNEIQRLISLLCPHDCSGLSSTMLYQLYQVRASSIALEVWLCFMVNSTHISYL